MKELFTNITNEKNLKKATRCLLRAALYRALAKAYSYPVAGTKEAIIENLTRVLETRDLLPSTLSNAVKDALAPLLTLENENLESEYLRVFTHVCAADCNPCESSYVCKHLFQVSQNMANLSGFYRNFGVEPTGERHDHVSVELEFLGYLAFREAREEAEGRASKAREVRRAQKLFLERHLGRWFLTFAFLVKRKAQEGVFYEFTELAEMLLDSEVKRLKASLAPVKSIGELPLPITNGDSERFPSDAHETSVYGFTT
ncbi:MAG TPA: molecular chaperone TorD family protein [Fimbriimonadales bacterium]|nr:molecular chaperone TorD family protein [Fimbriimonadales bacterium]